MVFLYLYAILQVYIYLHIPEIQIASWGMKVRNNLQKVSNLSAGALPAHNTKAFLRAGLR